MKNISKSIRLSERVYEYIESYEGNGFNQKFENIILFAMEGEIQAQKRLDYLEHIISVRNEELNKLNHNLNKARGETERFLYALKTLEDFIS